MTEERKRPRCPFFGFKYLHGKFIEREEKDQKHGCPLQNNNGPCVKLATKKTPEWEKCHFTHYVSLISFFPRGEYSCRVLPNEFKPKEESRENPWNGIDFKAWTEYVLGKELYIRHINDLR